jgi:hypothetical protein
MLTRGRETETDRGSSRRSERQRRLSIGMMWRQCKKQRSDSRAELPELASRHIDRFPYSTLSLSANTMPNMRDLLLASLRSRPPSLCVVS